MKNADSSYYLAPTSNPEKKYFVQEWNPHLKTAVFYIHGFPGCSDQAKLITSAPQMESFRLIAIDRPGYGRSEFQPGLTPLKFADHALDLLNQMNVDEVRLLTVSGGAPFAMALAHRLGDRVVRMSTVAGIAPVTRRNFRYLNVQQRRAWFMTKLLPFTVKEKILRRVWDKGLANVDEFLFTPSEGVQGPDQKVFTHPEFSPVLSEALKLALSQGPQGILHDLGIYANNWGFPTESISCPVTLWHGTKDDIVHLEYAKDMKSRLPNSNLKIIDDEGHYSIAMNCRDHIISDLLQA